MPEPGEYKVVMSTDDYCFGGSGRIWHETYTATVQPDGRVGFMMYLPSRTAAVLQKVAVK
jgi:1,4-alpha-glucan branching enzyme